jgi:hypothetical protein
MRSFYICKYSLQQKLDGTLDAVRKFAVVNQLKEYSRLVSHAERKLN